MKTRILSCACCGGDSFRGYQNPQKDQGYGTCLKCQTWILQNRINAIGHPVQHYADHPAPPAVLINTLQDVTAARDYTNQCQKKETKSPTASNDKFHDQNTRKVAT